MMFLFKLRCWLRGYHVKDASGVGKWRYDQTCNCYDCGT
jgi:hypothetical protein